MNDQLYERLKLVKYRDMGKRNKRKIIEVHADGVKEVEREECPFCKPTWCDEPHCEYTPKDEE